MSNEDQKREDYIKDSLIKVNIDWYGWKFQIRWNKLGWVDPKRCNRKKISFAYHSSSSILNITIWFLIELEIYKRIPIEIGEFFKRKPFNDTTDTKKQVSDEYAQDLNANPTQIDQDVTTIVEAKTEYESVNPEQQGVTITVDTKTEDASVNIGQKYLKEVADAQKKK